MYLIFGVDRSSVYHVDLNCPAITGRVGWLGGIEQATLTASGQQTIARGSFRSGTYERRPCKRCAS